MPLSFKTPYYSSPPRYFCVDFNSYRFQFNGKESDNEINGTGNDYDFGARIYESRLGRWLSIDPFENDYPSHSGFNFVKNNPIIAIDPDGKKVFIVIDKYKEAEVTNPLTGAVTTQIVMEKVVLDVSKKSDMKQLHKLNPDLYRAYKIARKSDGGFINSMESNENHDVYLGIGYVDQKNAKADKYHGGETFYLANFGINKESNNFDHSLVKGVEDFEYFDGIRLRTNTANSLVLIDPLTFTLKQPELSSSGNVADAICHEFISHIKYPKEKGIKGGENQHKEYDKIEINGKSNRTKVKEKIIQNGGKG